MWKILSFQWVVKWLSKFPLIQYGTKYLAFEGQFDICF